MVPVKQLLDRIRWDPIFGTGLFELGILDRVAGSIERVRLEQVRFEPGNRFFITLKDESGEERIVPLHRIRAVYRNGECIWHREVPHYPH